MKRKWEQCPHGEAGTRWSSLYVTMNTKGYLSLSRFTFEKMGEPETALLLYDRANNTIGILPASRLTRDAFPVSRKSDRGGRVIYALRLLQEFGIKITHSIRFMHPEFDEDGILMLDLNDTRPAQKGRNGLARVEDL